MKAFTTIGTVFAIVAATVQLVSLWNTYSSEGASGVLSIVLEAYDQLKNLVAFPIEAGANVVVDRLRTAFDWSFELHAHWKDTFVLLVLYVSPHASHAFYGNLPKPRRAQAIRVCWGALSILTASFVSGLIPLSGDNAALLSIGCALGGVLSYRLGFAVQYAADRAELAGKNFWREFGKKATGGITMAAGGALILLAGSGIGTLEGPPPFDSTAFVTLLVLLIFLGLFHVASALADGLADKSESRVILRKGAMTIGRNILIVVFFATLTVLGFGLI